MELGDIQNLDKLNSILQNTLDRGITQAVKVSWGSRDFVLRSEDGSTTIVKMKDLVKKFQDLSKTDSKGNKDPKLIDSIQEKLMKLDLRGDSELKQLGWLSEKFRDLKNIVTPKHFKAMDAIERPLTQEQNEIVELLIDKFAKNPKFQSPKNLNDKTNLESAAHDIFQDSKFDKDFLSDPDFQIATMSLLRTKPDVFQKLSLALSYNFSKNIDPKKRDFLDLIRYEFKSRYDRDLAIKSLKDDLIIGQTWLNELTSKGIQNTTKFVESYYNEPWSYIDWGLEAVKDLVANDPGKAFPLVNAMAKSNYENSEAFRNPNWRNGIKTPKSKELIIAHQEEYKKLLTQCKKNLLERIEGYSNEYELTPGSEYFIKYKFPRTVDTELLKQLLKLSGSEQGQPFQISNRDEGAFIQIKPSLFAKLLGMDESSLNTLITSLSQSREAIGDLPEEKKDLVISSVTDLPVQPSANVEKKAVDTDEIAGPLDRKLKEAKGDLVKEKITIEKMINNKEYNDDEIFDFFIKNNITKKPYYTGTNSDPSNIKYRPFIVSQIAFAIHKGQRKDLAKKLGITIP